jgi:prepilin-type N-terminal cleavage/methylation domain-containing protein
VLNRGSRGADETGMTADATSWVRAGAVRAGADRRPPGGTPRPPADAGVSLVEMLVAMMVSSVLLAGLGAVTMGSFKAARFISTKASSTSGARVAVERMSRTLRVAVQPAGTSAALVSGNYDAVTFYALLGDPSMTTTPAPTLVEYYIDATSHCLREATTPAQTIIPVPGSGPLYSWTAGRTTRCLVTTTQTPTSAAPLFSFYSDSLLLASGASPTPITLTASGLSAASLPTVRSVAVSLSVTDPQNTDVPPVLEVSKVTLDNVILGAGGRA